MDGLECNEIMLSTVESSNSSIRLDSHFYEKKYVRLKSKLCSMPHWHLKDIVSKPIQTGHTPSMSNQVYYGGNINFIKTDNLRHNRIIGPFADTLSESGNAVIARTSLQPLDIITTIIGATEEVIARTALVAQEDLPANINQNIVQIRIDSKIASPEYISIFLNTDYGRNYMRYLSRQTEQVNLNCSEVEDILVPKFSTIFQSIVEKLAQSAYAAKRQAMNQYKGAEILLLSALNYQPIEQVENHTTKSFSESFGLTGRLDAEYYQPKYDEYLLLVKSFSNGYVKISDVFNSVKTKCIRDKESYRYVEIGDIDIESGMALPNEIETYNLPDNAKIMTRAGDILVSTVRPNRGAVAILEEDELLVSGAFTVLRQSGNYPKEVLQVLLRTQLYRDWLLQTNVGTSYPVIKDADVLNFLIPTFTDDVNLRIIEKVQESFSLRRRSERLLENAKHAVELAIEQGEDEAMKWLQEPDDTQSTD